MTEPPLIAGMSEKHRLRAMAQILDGYCPWCDTSKRWRSVGLHLAAKHSMSAVDVRGALNIPPWVPLCSPQLSEKRAEMIRQWAPWDDARGKQVRGKGVKRISHYTKTAQADAARKRASEYQAERVPKHGTLHEYRRYKCRCGECRKVAVADAMKYKIKRQADANDTPERSADDGETESVL